MRITFALIATVLLASTIAHADVTCRVNDPTGTPLNVRATAPKGRILGTLKNGTTVRILDVFSFEGKVWARLGDKDRVQIGWVYRDYLDCEASADSGNPTLPPYPATTNTRNGTEWLSFCTSTPKIDGAAARYASDCLSYPRGLADGVILWKILDPDHGLICIPEAATAGQLRDVTINFIRGNPKDRHLNIAILMGLAFQDAWPCSGKFKPPERD